MCDLFADCYAFQVLGACLGDVTRVAFYIPIYGMAAGYGASELSPLSRIFGLDSITLHNRSCRTYDIV